MSIFFLALSHILYLFTKCAPQFVRFPHNFLCHLQKSPGSIALFDVLSHFPVSYTHLDVYKRQRVLSQPFAVPLMGRVCRIWGAAHALSGTEQPPIFPAVAFLLPSPFLLFLLCPLQQKHRSHDTLCHGCGVLCYYGI